MWRPNEILSSREALCLRKLFKLLLPPCVIRAFREFQSAAVPKELLELGRYAFTQIFRSGIAFFAYDTIMMCIILWYPVARPGESAGREEVDEHQSCGFQVVPS